MSGILSRKSMRPQMIIIRISHCLLLLSLFGIVSGCTTGSYLSDRGHDAADILNLTLGKGVGASIHAGPVHAGLFGGTDNIGIRGGCLRSKWHQESSLGWSGLFDPLFAFPGGDGISTGCEWFRAPFDGSDVAELRNKLYEAEGVVPFIMIPKHNVPVGSNSAYYFTQLEVSVGLGLSIRLGLNPGEFVDFVLGWFKVDIYTDDLVGTPSSDKPSLTRRRMYE